MTDDLWLKTSIMARRGLAMAHAGKRHALTIEGQGSFRVNFEKVPGFINHRQPRGGLGL
jgi:hypothetical protein